MRARSFCSWGFSISRRLRASLTAALSSRATRTMFARGECRGRSRLAIMFGDVLPNCLSPVIVQATLLIAVGIVVEASLSFVGLGVEPPNPSWGGMLSDARKYIFSGEWWTYVFPGLAISLSVIGFNLLGDALREIPRPAPRRRHRGGGLTWRCSRSTIFTSATRPITAWSNSYEGLSFSVEAGRGRRPRRRVRFGQEPDRARDPATAAPAGPHPQGCDPLRRPEPRDSR